MICAHASAWMFSVVIVGFAMAGMLSAMTLEEMNQLLGQAVRKALIDFNNMSVPEAAYAMRIDRTLLEKALRGEGYRHLSLNHLIKLGPVFMSHLTRHLMWLTAQQRYVELIEALGVKERA